MTSIAGLDRTGERVGSRTEEDITSGIGPERLQLLDDIGNALPCLRFWAWTISSLYPAWDWASPVVADGYSVKTGLTTLTAYTWCTCQDRETSGDRQRGP